MKSSIGIDPKYNDSVHWYSAMDRLKFKKRICTRFIPKEIDRKCCVCNYTHHENFIPQSNEKWERKTHTKTEDTKCYGLLSPSNSPYIRCDIETEMEEICYMLLGVWNIPVPSLIIQMIGDADSTPNLKLEKELLQGISDSAIASDAWIITSGYREETISELIGEVVFDNRIKNSEINFSAIAVGKWGNINDCHKLDDRTNQSTILQGYGQYKLETNHTHYVFFDDGTCNSMDNGIFTSNLARQISTGARRKIPLVPVLVGGTLHALSSIHTNLLERIPIVIVNGSGIFADILCKYFKLTENFSNSREKNNEEEESTDDEDDMDIPMIDQTFPEDDQNPILIDQTESDDDDHLSSKTKMTLREALRPIGKNRSEFVNDIRNLYKIIRREEYRCEGKRLPGGELFTFQEEKQFGNYLYQFASCLTNPLRKLIHIFNINSSKSLKETIYDAFIQARNSLSKKKKNGDEGAHLALRWSIGEKTENQSVSTAQIWNDTGKIEYNRSLLIDALSKNLLLFVMNFVKLDIDFTVLFGPRDNSTIKSFIHWSPSRFYLKELYSYPKRKYRDPLYLLDQINSRVNFSEEKHLISILKELVGDIMHPFYHDQSKIGSTLLKVREDNQREDAEYIYRDLYLWCILTSRLDMAKIFLSQLNTRICSALIGSKILKSLSSYAPDQAAKDELNRKADEFETYAIEFVRCSYCYDKHQACELIMRRIDIYGGVTCLQMAINADNKKFLHEDACQALLTNIWYDKLDPVRERNQLFINIITCGISQIFISIYQKRFSKYSKIEKNNEDISSNMIIPPTHPERRLKKKGIDYTDDYDINETIMENFIHFHNRPIVKYCYTCFGYILFLCLFSYFMLFSFDRFLKKNRKIHWSEIVTMITVTTMLFEEFRQFYFQDHRSLKGKLITYFDMKNRPSNLCLIVPSYLLFYIGLILRFTQRDDESFVFARIVMSIDLELWFIRSVLFMGIAPNLGPKLVMIRHMTNDLLLFVIIIIIFIFGYGITSRSILSDNSIDFSGRTFFRDVIYPIYYFVLGSFDSEREKLNATQNSNTAFATHIVFALHMLFVNILLINLLIALFSFKINDVQTQARYVWAYDRYEIVRSYHIRPALFPPFTFLILIIQFFRWSFNRLKKKDNQSQYFKMIPINDTIDRAWTQFERYSTNDYTRQLLDTLLVALNKGITSDVISESSSNDGDQSRRIKTLLTDFTEYLEDSTNETEKKFESNITDLQSRLTQIETRFDRWNNDIKQVKTSLNWMMMALAEAKFIPSEPPIIEDNSRKNSTIQQQPGETKTTRSIRKSHPQRSTMDKSPLNEKYSSKSNLQIEKKDQN